MIEWDVRIARSEMDAAERTFTRRFQDEENFHINPVRIIADQFGCVRRVHPNRIRDGNPTVRAR
jgi:hypothetical protein